MSYFFGMQVSLEGDADEFVSGSFWASDDGITAVSAEETVSFLVPRSASANSIYFNYITSTAGFYRTNTANLRLSFCRRTLLPT